MIFTDFKFVRFSKIQAIFFWLIFLGFSSFCYSNPSNQNLIKTDNLQSLTLWNQVVQYQLIVKEDLSMPSDGEAFIHKSGAQKINYVVLNEAYFGKEAGELFDRFKNLSFSSSSMKKSDSTELLEIEYSLLSLKDASFFKETPSLTDRRKTALKELKSKLENLAWRNIYEDSLKNSFSPEEAKRKFTEAFMKVRKNTILHHEVSHLIDLENTQNSQSEDFKKYTELNAFYTELVYTTNPYDVMAGAVVGLIDEMNRKKEVDYSIEKVSTVLSFLKRCPRFAKLFKMGPMPKCCLELLADIHPADFIFVGNQLYRQKPYNLKQTFAYLR